MNKDNTLWTLFVAVLAAVWLVIAGFLSELDAAGPVNSDNIGSTTAKSGGIEGVAVAPIAVSRSYYVVNNDLYVLMQQPMAKAFGAFSIAPVIVPDAVGYIETDAVYSGLSSGDTLSYDTTGSAHISPKSNDNALGIEVVSNINFRGSPEKTKDRDPGLDTDRDKEYVNEYIADPFEAVNRVFFAFNDKLYFWVLKPSANVYSAIVPEWGRSGIRNVFDNIQAPIRLANALLQGNMPKFGAEFAGFILNSTVGLGGLFDIAARHPELRTSEEDLGQTLGYYGLGEGFYLVLPFLGPSSLRDAAGKVGDSFIDPVWHITPLRDAVSVRSFDLVNETSFMIGDYEDIKESALDPYLSIRDMYKQYRRNLVRE